MANVVRWKTKATGLLHTTPAYLRKVVKNTLPRTKVAGAEAAAMAASKKRREMCLSSDAQPPRKKLCRDDLVNILETNIFLFFFERHFCEWLWEWVSETRYGQSETPRIDILRYFKASHKTDIAIDSQNEYLAEEKCRIEAVGFQRLHQNKVGCRGFFSSSFFPPVSRRCTGSRIR